MDRRKKKLLQLSTLVIVAIFIFVLLGAPWLYYILNKGKIDLGPTTVVMEAEDALFIGVSNANMVEQPLTYAPIATSNNKYIGNFAVIGNKLSFALDATKNTVVDITWKLANVLPQSENINLEGTIAFYCNETIIDPETYTLNSSCDGEIYTNWDNIVTKQVNLNKGLNILVLEVLANNKGVDSKTYAPNVDCIFATDYNIKQHEHKISGQKPTCINSGKVNYDCPCGYKEDNVILPPTHHNLNENHICSVCKEKVYVFEAENAVINGNHNIEQDKNASAGYGVANLKSESSITFNIESAEETKATLSWVLFSTGAEDVGNYVWINKSSTITQSQVKFSVNGSNYNYSSVNLEGSEKTEWFLVSTVFSFETTLKKGKNTIVLTAQSNSEIPNVDYIQIGKISNNKAELKLI